MQQHDIISRGDIELLVTTFYKKVRKHPTLAPIFNEIISDWDEHISKLSDFWQTNLFFVKAYKGNPLHAHISTDQQVNHTIEQVHFGNWLQLWFETLDELFTGKNTELAKNRARNMAHIMFIRIFQARKDDLHTSQS